MVMYGKNFLYYLLLECILSINFQNNPTAPPASNSRLSPLPPEPAGFNYDREATIDIPLDTSSGGSHYQVGEDLSLNSICIIWLSVESHFSGFTVQI